MTREPSIAGTDALFAWGDDNAELWRRLPWSKNSFIVDQP